jgi:hypothetical protein
MRRRKRDSDRRHASRTAAPERGKAARDIERAIHALKDFQAASQLPRPDQFPGTVPQMPVSPDLIKLDYATWVERQPRLAEQLRQLQDDYERGTLHWVDAARSWALEEFLWHGYPGGDSSPLDHYLDAREAKYPAEALEQLRQWKVAKFGMFRVGRVRRDAVELTPIDSRGTSTGPMFKAISLNVGGVNVFLGRRGDTLITYVAPWSEEPCIACCMGYGTTWPSDRCGHSLSLAARRARAPEVPPRVEPTGLVRLVRCTARLSV